MLTGEQIRAARALARIEQAALAEVSGVSLPTIKRLETAVGAISANTTTETALRRAFAQAGVVFVDENGQGGGVRLRRSGHPLKIRERVDEGMTQLRADGVELLEIRLTIVEAALFAKSFGSDSPPDRLDGVPVIVDATTSASVIRGRRPNVPTRVTAFV